MKKDFLRKNCKQKIRLKLNCFKLMPKKMFVCVCLGLEGSCFGLGFRGSCPNSSTA